MPRAIISFNLGLRFLLELTALGATADWGYHSESNWSRWLVAAATVVAVAVIWGRFVSPKRSVDAPVAVRGAIELAVWIAAALALWSIGHAQLAIAFLVVAVISGAANAIWSGDGPIDR
jgi:hypothetical protein